MRKEIIYVLKIHNKLTFSFILRFVMEINESKYYRNMEYYLRLYLYVATEM